MDSIDDKNPADCIGQTPLHRAAKGGYVEICQLLIDNVEDKHPRDNVGLTPLELARYGHWSLTYF